MAVPFQDGLSQFFDDSGNPLAGGLVYTYAAGTTNAKFSYTTQAGDVEHDNPIELDSGGRASIWLGDGGYRFDIRDSAGVLIDSVDNVTPDAVLTVDASGINYTGAYTSSEVQTVAARLGRMRMLTDWGVVGDGTDEATKINLAIAEMVSAGGGVLYVPKPPATYGIGSQIVVRGGVILWGEGFGDTSTSASQPDAPATSFTWLGGSGGTDPMFLFKSATASEYIYGAGMVGITVKGANAAYEGLKFSSPRRCLVDRVWVERVRSTALVMDDSNGVLCASNTIGEFQYTAGANVAAAGSHGVVIRSATGVGCTGTELRSLITVTVNGDGLVIGDHDNGYFAKVFTSTSGTGQGTRFRGLTDSQTRVSRKNVINFAGGDSIYAETGSLNVVQWINSEGTSVIIEAGASLDYQVIDRNDGRRWGTFKYMANDYRQLSLSDGYAVDGSPVLTVAGGNSARVVAFDSAADESWQWTIPPLREWSGGRITGVVVEGQKSATGGAGDIVWRLEGVQRTTANNVGGGTLLTETMAAVASDADGAQTLQKFTLMLTTPWVVDFGSHFLFRLKRYAGTSASDTLAQDFHVTSVQIIYEADIADSELNGKYRYQIPADYV